MADPLNIVVNVVNGILTLVKEAKTNQEGCQLLASLAERTLSTLRQLENRELTDPLMTRALELVNVALNDAQKAIEDCSKSNFFLAMAAEKLENALSQVSVASVGMTADIQSELAALSEHSRKAKFNERAEMAQQTQTLMAALDKAFFQTGQGTEDVKELIAEVLEQQSSSRDELRNELKVLKKHAIDARQDKDRQLEFKLDEIIGVISNSLGDVYEVPTVTPDLKDRLCCPITKDIMRDPVIIKESGMIYDRSSIIEWLERGHNYDPITKDEIKSADFLPCRALQDTCQLLLAHGRTSCEVQKSILEESNSHVVVSGLYEVHGKFSTGSAIVHASQLLILEPNGLAVGCCLYEIDNDPSQRNKLEIGSGTWDTRSLQLSYEDDCYLYKGEIAIGINGRQMGREWRGKVSMVDTKEEEREFLFFYFSPVVSQSIWARPGILQMEGDIVSPRNKVQYNSKLILVLEADCSIEGCMWFESATSEIKTIGHVIGGIWEPDGSVAFKVEFSLTNKPHSLKINRRDHFASYKVTGSLISDGKERLPAFIGLAVKVTGYGALPNDQSAYIPLDDQDRLEYSYVREATTPWYHFVQDSLHLFQISDDYELEPGEYFIRAELDSGSGLTPYYLCAGPWTTDFIPLPDTHIMWAVAEPKKGQDQWHFADVWKVDKENQSSTYRLSIKASHMNARNNMDHVGKSLTIWRSEDAGTNRGNAYLCVKKTIRIEEKLVWSLKKRHGRLHLVLEGGHNSSIGGNAEYFVSNPVFEQDRRNWHTLYAPLTQDVKQALKICIERAQY